MITKTATVVVSLFALGMAATPGFAADNVIPGPLEDTPANPAAADSAAARVPTTENLGAEKTHKVEKTEKTEPHKDVAPYTKQ